MSAQRDQFVSEVLVRIQGYLMSAQAGAMFISNAEFAGSAFEVQALEGQNKS